MKKPLITIETTKYYDKWRAKLKDPMAMAQIVARLLRIQNEGFFGDVESVGNGVYELRFHVGAGYRIYFAKKGDSIVLLLCGGNKTSQQDDIKKAYKLAKEL